MFIERLLAGSAGIAGVALVALAGVEAVKAVAAAAHSWAVAITSACNLGV